MLKFIFSIAAAFITLLCNAQVSQDRTITDFSKISVSNGINVTYTQSANISLQVEADSDEHLKMVKTEVSAGVLKIYIDNTSKIRNFKTLNVIVSANNVKEFSSDSGSSIQCKGQVSQPSVAIEASSGSRFDGEIKSRTATVSASSGAVIKLSADTSDLSLKANSGASLTLSGKATNVAIKSDSGSVVNAKALSSNVVVVNASSGASVSVTVADSITGNADSSSSVHYFGSPKTETISKKSMASIRKN